jgi:hypothetical protein
VCREQGGVLPAIGPVDELLDERNELTVLSKTRAFADWQDSSITG